MADKQTTAYFHYEMKLEADNTHVSLSQRLDPNKSSTTLLNFGELASSGDIELWYSTDPDWSEFVDPQSVAVQLSFDDTGKHPDTYHGTITCMLNRDQLTRLRDFADFLLDRMPAKPA